MANKTVLKKDSTKESKPTLNQGNNKNIAQDKVADKKQKTPIRKSSGIVAGAVGRSAVDAVKGNSSRDVRGSSGLANTGTIISYD
ncbi:MAG: hypothetical protein ABIU77_14630 [Ferruginibacter sp.]|jgi:hypothetical protein